MNQDVLFIGITGGAGSGKTTFAQSLYHRLRKYTDQVGILAMDSYYRPLPEKFHPTDRGFPNFDHPSAFDWELLLHHLQMLRRGERVQCPVYSFHANTRLEATTALGPCRVLIFEGIFTLFKKEIRDLLDVKLFMQVDCDVRFTRRLCRDIRERGRTVESVVEQYYDSVRPMYRKYIRPQKKYADLIMGENTDVASAVLFAKIQAFLQLPRAHAAKELSAS